MRDIVSTIQRSRTRSSGPAPRRSRGPGRPGTGKTAVALHRAAYLLYTHRFLLERQGVLVIGPNPLFLRYIEQVLPSLGESGVTLSTVTGLVHGAQRRGEDPPVARLKVRPAWRASWRAPSAAANTDLRHDAEVPYGPAILRLRAKARPPSFAAARRRPGGRGAARPGPRHRPRPADHGATGPGADAVPAARQPVSITAPSGQPPRRVGYSIRKYLPDSYRDSFKNSTARARRSRSPTTPITACWKLRSRGQPRSRHRRPR